MLTIEKKLLEKNTNPTSMRIRIYECFQKQQIALSLADLETYLERADRVTIYRTLKTFEEKGIVHSIQDQNITKYMLCEEDCDEENHQDTHLHFYCKICKQTTCKDDFVMPNWYNKNYKIESLQLMAQGICELCMP